MGLEAKHLSFSQDHLRNGKALDKDSTLCVTNLYVDITIDVYLSCAHKNHKSQQVVSFIFPESSPGH